MIDRIWVTTHNSSVPRVSEATKVEHRQRLLEAAAAEFAAKGLDGARVDEISLAAGLAKGTIYNYFDSKQHVFREVIAAWFERIAERRVAVPEDAPVREQLLAVVQADMEVTGELEEFARVAYREVLRADPTEAAELVPSRNPVDDDVVAIIERAQRNGLVSAGRSAISQARVVAALITGLLFEHWLPDAELGLADIPELVVDTYLDGFGV